MGVKKGGVYGCNFGFCRLLFYFWGFCLIGISGSFVGNSLLGYYFWYLSWCCLCEVVRSVIKLCILMLVILFIGLCILVVDEFVLNCLNFLLGLLF